MQNTVQQQFTVMLIGAPGAGKSLVGNILTGSNHFKSENSCVEGVTREPSFFQGPALGIQGNFILNVLDMPGLCDLSLPLAQMINQIETKVGSTEFDAVIVVIKQSDYRASLQEVMAIKVIKNLMKHVKAQNIFLILTHCDQSDPNEDFILQKLDSLKKWGGIQILRENTFKFFKSKESLQSFIQKLVPGNIKFEEDLVPLCDKILQELPGDFKKQDQVEGTQNLKQFQMMLDLFKEQNEELKEERKFLSQKLDQQQERIYQLSERIANMPSGGGRKCQLI